ncbi:MAG TPA: HAMP domain-containing protein [Candidatus Polarisedimenticolia bacterium]|nr:HAMP domain-containing protein [Candidatus Polarisedimenticolia bacterium]
MPRGPLLLKLPERTREFERRLSLRTKVSLSIFFSFLVLMPVTGLSLFYLNNILEDIINITQVDTRFVEAARSIRDNVETAADTEIAFVLLRENSYLDQNRRAMDQIRRTTLQGLEHLGSSTDFERIPDLASQYDLTMTRLADLYAVPTGAGAEPLADFERGLARLQERLRSLGDSLATRKDPAARRLLLEKMRRATQSTSQVLLESLAQENPGRAAILEELARIRERIDAVAEGVQKRSLAHIEEHRRHVVAISNRAQRNILTTIVLTGLAGVSLILFLPARVVRRLRRMTHIVQQAERGDLDVTTLETGSDEVGTLAVHLNRLIGQVRTFDEIKTERMLSAERRLEGLVENLEEGVILIDGELHPVYVSRRARQLLGVGADGADDARISAILTNDDLSSLIRDALGPHEGTGPRVVTLDVGEREPRRFRVWADPVTDPAGEIKEILLLIRKVA